MSNVSAEADRIIAQLWEELQDKAFEDGMRAMRRAALEAAVQKNPRLRGKPETYDEGIADFRFTVLNLPIMLRKQSAAA